ncbi:MAG: nicotinate (nicotinamide) nucleotide adenylyltransferase [Lachnospiraceae bacterium]|nr:nicotinate (nicotinamide) nucleotide adenylyltransferase [Lachnospiraceae bacterium]
MARIGILGGTFSPIHNGHIYIAKEAMEQLCFDELWFLPAGIPPHKKIRSDISPLERLTMCEVAVDALTGARVIDDEIWKRTPSYTYETLECFHQKYPQHEFFFIIGEDSLDSFHQWVKPERICELATILVATRSANIANGLLEDKVHQVEAQFHGHFQLITSEYVDVSSTMLREKLAHRESIEEYVPKGVWEYIRMHRLYEDIMGLNKDLEKEIRKELKEHLKKSRYEHTLGVTYTACALAMRYNYPLEVARFAGLLHDCAKYLSDKEQLEYCHKHRIQVTEAEEKAPYLLHAKIGAYMAQHQYKIEDEELIHAIEVHTTGCPNMSLLDKILFTADYIEPNREEAPRLEDIRGIAFQDLDKAVYMILEDSIQYVKETNRPMDPTTLESFEYYKTQLHQ